jgi:hypothetical protein
VRSDDGHLGEAGGEPRVTGVEDRGQAVLGDHLVQPVREPIVREKALHRRVELEATQAFVDQAPASGTPSRPL